MASKVSKFFYDFEFLDTGNAIYPLSLGMIADNAEHNDDLYIVFGDAPWGAVYRNLWLRENVLTSIEYKIIGKDRIEVTDPNTLSKYAARSKLLDFVDKHTAKGTEAEFWAYYAAYDHVALAQMFGTMKALPANFPMHTMDLKQLAVLKGSPELPKSKAQHNALADAHHNYVIYQFLSNVAYTRG